MPTSLKALIQLGMRPALLYVWYQLKLRTGLLRFQTPARDLEAPGSEFGLAPLFKPPIAQRLKDLLGAKSKALLKEAAEILDGEVRLFGADPQPLDLAPPAPLGHWTTFPIHAPTGEDIKLIWEPARFGWAATLARAYQLTGKDEFAEAVWARLEEFLAANPPNQGPHWASAQEVALRLIHLAFAYSVIAPSPATTPERRMLLVAAIIAHARRIPPTLAYARAQNNNHLLSEALGLITAAALLPEHSRADSWNRLGWRWFEQGLHSQVAEIGTYAQHSANYQRLVLQLGLWANLLAQQHRAPLPSLVAQRLAALTYWQLRLLDMESGALPNLGPNDGAYILPLSIQPFGDHRPVLQAAGFAFLGEHPIPPGVWDELALWLVQPPAKPLKPPARPAAYQPPLRLQGRRSWAYLRTARFHSRPGHADQLHLDLWWRGLNLALDPGSYRYTAPAPWDNALAATRVHNTLTVDGRDQMTRARRFLWLDWAQARLLDTGLNDIGHLIAAAAKHDGYRGLRHQRTVRVDAKDQWTIEDQLLPHNRVPAPVEACLHWLLPDWPWLLTENTLTLKSPRGHIAITLEAEPGMPKLALVRAGEVVQGELDPDPILGWHSPTYTVKEPALSLILSLEAVPPLTITTSWTLPG
jgi:hypothetical protein